MKVKILILLSVFLLYPVSVFAQWGVKGGVDFSTFFYSPSVSLGKYQTGFNIGAIYDIKLSKKMYFQPGLLFVTNGIVYEPNLLREKVNVNMYAIEVPLVMSFRPNIGDKMKLITDFGFYTRYGLLGKTKYDYTISGGDSYVIDSFDDYSRFDMGLNLGIGVSYLNYALVGTCQLGFTDVEKGVIGIKHQKNRISLIYYF
ncbi:MAG: PorT family protein [Tannerella sp.]|jgi:hypothetical protein|nr:PorT family protein [Tannerella sp.]